VLFKTDSLTKIWNVTPRGVLHVGAHKAEESSDYERLKWGHVIWVEAQPDLANELRRKLDPEKNQVINAAIWGKSGLVFNFKVSSNTESSSLLEFGTHKDDYPDISVTGTYQVTTSTLEDVLEKSSSFDFLNLDIQGAELEALQGLGSHFEKIRWIYTEVNKGEVYKNCAQVSEIDAFLKTKGFKRIATRWVRNQGWGDALYVQKDVSVSLISRLRAIFDYARWVKSQHPAIQRKVKTLLKKLDVITIKQLRKKRK